MHLPSSQPTHPTAVLSTRQLAYPCSHTPPTKPETQLKSQVAKLEGELGKARAQAQAVDNVIVDADVLAGLQGRDLDQQIQAAWDTAQSFKQRWLECKGALDSVKSGCGPTGALIAIKPLLHPRIMQSNCAIRGSVMTLVRKAYS